MIETKRDMEDISREEAKCIIKQIHEMAKFIYVNDEKVRMAMDKAISDMEKLDGYKTKLKNAYGECDTLLDVVVDGFVKQAEEHKIGQPRKSRLLTDEHVDAWEQAKSDRKKLQKIEQIISDISDYEYEDCEFDMRMIEQIVKE